MDSTARKPAVRILSWSGWDIALGVLYSGFEILRAVLEKPHEDSIGFANLSRLAGITSWCYWLAVPWCLVVLAVWFTRWKRRQVRVVNPTEAWALLLVVAAVVFATYAGIRSQVENIRIFY